MNFETLEHTLQDQSNSKTQETIQKLDKLAKTVTTAVSHFFTVRGETLSTHDARKEAEEEEEEKGDVEFCKKNTRANQEKSTTFIQKMILTLGRAKKTLATSVRHVHITSPTPPTSMLQAYASSTRPNINERFFCTLHHTQKPPTLK